MLSGIKTAFASGLSGIERQTSKQHGQGTARQQDAAPTQRGGGTLQSVVGGQTTLSGQNIQQSNAARTTERGRFRAFSQLSLFRKSTSSQRGAAGKPQRAEAPTPLNRLDVAIPTTAEGSLEHEISALLAERQAYQAEEQASLGIQLNEQRNATVAAPQGRDAQRALLKQTIGHEKMRYQSVVASKNHQQHTLLDEGGRLLSLHSSRDALIGVAHSRSAWAKEETPGSAFPRRKAAETIEHALTLNADGSAVQIRRSNSPGVQTAEEKLPDAAVLSQLSGIWHQPASEGSHAFRLSNDKLYQLTSHTEGWQKAMLAGGDKDQAKLSRQADNALYLVHDDYHLYNLQTQSQSVRFADKISNASVAADGQTLVVLTNNENKQQSVRLLPRFDSSAASQRTLQLIPGKTSLAALAQTDSLVIAADHQGRLLVANRPGEADKLNFGDAHSLTLRDRLHQQIAEVTGDRFHVLSLLNGENNQLHAVVKDSMDRQHAIALNPDPARPQVSSSWNLSDSLVMDYQKGLPQPAPERKDIVDIGANGKLMLHDGKVHFFNELTNGWEASEVKADRLRAGQDGQAWVLKDNQLKRLKVNVASNKINFQQNAFALHQIKKSVSEELAMPGLDKNQATVAASVLDNGRFATLEEKGDIHFHHVDTESRRNRRLPQTLTRQALSEAMNRASAALSLIPEDRVDHKVTDIVIGPESQLFILSDKGKVFSLPAQSWQQGKLDKMQLEKLPAQIKDEADETPDALPARFYGNQKEALLLEMDNSRLLARSEHGWHPVPSAFSPGDRDAENMADRHYDRLSSATRDARLGKTGITWKREINTFGQSGHDGHKVHTPFRTRLSTFVFRPTLETPRPLKNLGSLVQHTYGGRQGLTAIYQQQTHQLAELTRHLKRQQTGKPQEPLSLRLKALASQDNLPNWFSEMQSFNAVLADSAALQAGLLQQHYGAQSGAVRQMAKLTNGLNPASTRSDELLDKLHQLFSSQPSGKGNHAQLTLNALKNAGVTLSHQKPAEAIPAGLHRDTHDPLGLVKSRLILDGLTNVKMHDLTTRLSRALHLQGEPRDKALRALGNEFRALRDEEWEGNPLKQVTSQGFTGNDRLEANYDAIKSMTKAFSKANHAMNVTTRTVMQAEDQQMLARRMGETVLAMEKGESIAFSRAYGAATTMSVLPGSQVIAGVGGRGSLDRGYNMSLTRSEGGVNVSFGRDGGGSLTAFTGIGYNLLTGYMKDPAHDVAVDHQRNLAPAVRVGGVFSATPLDVKKQNSISFEITEAELPTFIKGLMEGTLEPLTLLNRGINHSVKKGEVLNVSLDANAAALASAGIPVTNKHEKETPASFRVGGGAYAGVNLLSGTRERGSTSKEGSSTESRSNNRPRGLNKASVGVNFALPTGVLIKGAEGRVPLFAGPAASVQLSIDNRTKQSLTIETKMAQPLEAVHIDKLMETLGKKFSDPATAALMAALKDKEDDETPLTPAQKLDKIDAHFTPRNLRQKSNEQQAALRDLDKHLRQQSAAEKGQKLLQNGEYQTTYANLSKVDSNGIWHQLSHLLDGSLNASNANKMRELMKDDRQLQTLIAALQDNVSTEATVTLELKDDVREKLEKRWLEQGNSPEEMRAELTRRDNLRLKSIAFSKSQVKTDGFATPAFLLGGSNSASVSMKRNLGKISFSYGENQDNPVNYALEGRIAKATAELAGALQQGQQQHYVLKS
ncbi:AvrE-family type 3 secretion system effector [Erwinia phyllosphaerae]|uniref:AvrE-family type 3 secretion system effector n=1 Tax=Erwinia phyllosphaerae TaxID=2853256 RepID=UPI001FEDA7EE|nr:AvrE-family type 3 secretion system effector [Erwinia phyllosphaerae]